MCLALNDQSWLCVCVQSGGSVALTTGGPYQKSSLASLHSGISATKRGHKWKVEWTGHSGEHAVFILFYFKCTAHTTLIIDRTLRFIFFLVNFLLHLLFKSKLFACFSQYSRPKNIASFLTAYQLIRMTTQKQHL